MLLDVLTVLVLGFVGARLVASARAAVRSSELRRRTLDIVRDVRPAHVLRALPVLAVVLVLASLSLAVPVLRTGWWTAIGGTGNIVTGATDRTRGTPLAWLVPALFLALLVPLLPLFAEREEQIFRAGAESWSFWRRVRRGLEFGLAHVIMGIPIGVALALSVGGWYLPGCTSGPTAAVGGPLPSWRARGRTSPTTRSCSRFCSWRLPWRDR